MHVIIKHLSKSSEVPNLDYKTCNSLKFYRTLLNCSESEDKDSKNFASKFVENLSILGDKLQHGAFLASYGSTTVSLTFGEGTIEYVHITRSGYSSLIFDMRRVPMPAPVPPPRECVLWHVSSGFLVNCCKFYGLSSQKKLQFEKYDTKINRLLFQHIPISKIFFNPPGLRSLKPRMDPSIRTPPLPENEETRAGLRQYDKGL